MPKSTPTKPKRLPGRPLTGGVKRPILERTSVAASTLEGIKAERRPVGRVVDDAWTAYEITRKAATKAGVDHAAFLLRLV